jgi:hypothetical protein
MENKWSSHYNKDIRRIFSSLANLERFSNTFRGWNTMKKGLSCTPCAELKKWVIPLLMELSQRDTKGAGRDDNLSDTWNTSNRGLLACAELPIACHHPYPLKQPTNPYHRFTFHTKFTFLPDPFRWFKTSRTKMRLRNATLQLELNRWH